MSSARLYRTDAIILRRFNTGEADRILTVFTPKLGKLRLTAKGSRKITSRKAGHIELFMLTDMLVARGRTLDVITQAEALQTFPAIREDLDKTSQSYYLAELIDGFTEEGDINTPLFELILFTFTHLNHLDDTMLLLRYFELHLLSLTGFQPQLHFCVISNKLLEPVDNYFSFVDGGMVSPDQAKPSQHVKLVPLPALKVLRYMQTQPWEKIATLQLTPKTSEYVELLLLGYITYLLERRLKSVHFLNRLRSERKL